MRDDGGMSISRLFVLLGAGASRGAVSNGAYEPPLTSELFAERFNGILLRYPAVDTAAAEIRRATARGGVALEKHLAEKYAAPDGHAHALHTGRALPLYLQEVLTEASCCAWEPRNYDLLWRPILEHVDSVTFITLNYDTILDGRLAAGDAPLDTLEDYIASDRRWSLIKLHGSINWGYPIDNGIDDTGSYYAHRPSAGIRATGPIEMTRLAPWFDDREWQGHVSGSTPGPKLGAVVARCVGNALREARRPDYPANRAPLFPALALPLGANDRFVCPDTHVEHLRDQLDSSKDATLLVIGYSAIDSSVLDELRGKRLAACAVVDRNFETAAIVGRRLAEIVAVPDRMMLAFDGDFADFVADDSQLTGFLTNPRAAFHESDRENPDRDEDHASTKGNLVSIYVH